MSESRWRGMSVEYAATPWRRFRGLLFGEQKADILVLERCRDIHTFGMRYPIDVAFVGTTGVVIDARRGVRAGVRMRCARACAVLERYACPAKPWPRAGDIIDVALLEGKSRGERHIESIRNTSDGGAPHGSESHVRVSRRSASGKRARNARLHGRSQRHAAAIDGREEVRRNDRERLARKEWRS